MKRFFLGLFLVFFILICAFFILAKLGSLGPENNYFNSHFRLKLAKNPVFRKVLTLQNDGDSRSDYLGSGKSKILIEVDAMQGINVDLGLVDRFANAVSNITGKNVNYLVSDVDMTNFEVDDSQIQTLADKYHNIEPDNNTAILYLMLLSKKQGEAKQIGSTYKDFGIVVYVGSVEDFTQSTSATYRNYLFSTTLHEFGHQIGLGHNEEAGCIMNPKAETNDIAQLDPDNVVTDFCHFEQKLIAQQKSLAN